MVNFIPRAFENKSFHSIHDRTKLLEFSDSSSMERVWRPEDDVSCAVKEIFPDRLTGIHIEERHKGVWSPMTIERIVFLVGDISGIESPEREQA